MCMCTCVSVHAFQTPFIKHYYGFSQTGHSGYLLYYNKRNDSLSFNFPLCFRPFVCRLILSGTFLSVVCYFPLDLCTHCIQDSYFANALV